MEPSRINVLPETRSRGLSLVTPAPYDMNQNKMKQSIVYGFMHNSLQQETKAELSLKQAPGDLIKQENRKKRTEIMRLKTELKKVQEQERVLVRSKYRRQYQRMQARNMRALKQQMIANLPYNTKIVELERRLYDLRAKTKLGNDDANFGS